MMTPDELQRLLKPVVDRRMRLLVREAVATFGGYPEGIFNTACFAAALKTEYELPHVPDGNACAGILRCLNFVEELPGGCHWKMKGGAARA